MSDEGDFDLDELDRLREMTKSIKLFPGENGDQKEHMDAVEEEEKDAGDTSRGENSTPSQTSSNKREPVKKSLPVRQGPPPQVGGMHGRKPSTNSTKPVLKTSDVKKTMKNFGIVGPSIIQSQRAGGIAGIQNKLPSSGSLTDRRQTNDGKGTSLAESVEDIPLRNAASKDSAFSILSPLNQHMTDSRIIQSMPAGWSDEIRKLIDINAGMREDIEDKRDKLKAYIDRLTSMEATVSDCTRRSDACRDQCKADVDHSRREAKQEVVRVRLAMEDEFKHKHLEILSRGDREVQVAVDGIREAAQALRDEVDIRRETTRHIGQVLEHVGGVINEQFEAEERLRQKFEKIYDSLIHRLENQASNGGKSIEDKINRAKQLSQKESYSQVFDSDIQRIYDDQKKQSSKMNLGIDRPTIPDSAITDGESFNLYTDHMRTQRAEKTLNESSSAFSKTLTHSRTADKNKFLTTTDYSISRLETPKVNQTHQTVNYPIEDIPDNVSVSSRKSKRVLFNRKPISRSSKVENEYGMTSSRDESYRSPPASKPFWQNSQKDEDQYDLQSQPDLLMVEIV